MTAIPRSDYHTAHKPPLARLVPVDRFDGIGALSGRLTAFAHDLTTGLPDEYGACDVLVTDLPWRKGFDEFNRRAGRDDGRSYPEFMQAVSRIVKGSANAAMPTWLITGKHALSHLPEPDMVLPMRLNEDDALAIGYRPGPEAFGNYGIAQEFLREMTQHYDRAGDFCCGYGRTGRFFLRAGKAAVLSDINRDCVGYVATHAHEWIDQ